MKKMIVLLVMLVCQSVFAAIPENLLLDVSLRFKQRDQNGTFNEYLLTNNLRTNINNHDWITIQSHTESTSDKFILLGKIEDATANSVKMKFLVLDTGTTPGILYSPRLVVAFGKKGIVTVEDKNQKVELSILAKTKL